MYVCMYVCALGWHVDPGHWSVNNAFTCYPCHTCPMPHLALQPQAPSGAALALAFRRDSTWDFILFFHQYRKKFWEQMLSHPVRRVLLFSRRSRNLGIHTMAYLSLLDIESHTHTHTHTQSGTPSRLRFGLPGTKASCHKRRKQRQFADFPGDFFFFPPRLIDHFLYYITLKYHQII